MTTMLTKCDGCGREIQYGAGLHLSEPTFNYTSSSYLPNFSKWPGKDFCQFKCLKEWVNKKSEVEPNLTKFAVDG